MENYKILERIGEGTHGQVVQALLRSSGKIVAIKCVRSLDKASKSLLREIESLKALDSDYVCYYSYEISMTTRLMREYVIFFLGCEVVGSFLSQLQFLFSFRIYGVWFA